MIITITSKENKNEIKKHFPKADNFITTIKDNTIVIYFNPNIDKYNFGEFFVESQIFNLKKEER